jgi:hypothetical protein
MIVRALARGVSQEKLARALDVDVKVMQARRQLLAGISDEVADLLKDKPVEYNAFAKLRKMKPLRQLEVAELMASANNFTANYTKALLATSKASDLHRPDLLKKAAGLSTEQMARLEREMASVGEDYKGAGGFLWRRHARSRGRCWVFEAAASATAIFEIAFGRTESLRLTVRQTWSQI